MNQNVPHLSTPRLLALPQVRSMLGIGKTKLYALVSAGKFPPPIKIGKSSRWLHSEINTWLEQCVASRTLPGGNPTQRKAGQVANIHH